MPSSTEKQRKFMGADLQRAREGKKTKTGMSEDQLSDFASKPLAKSISERLGDIEKALAPDATPKDFDAKKAGTSAREQRDRQAAQHVKWAKKIDEREGVERPAGYKYKLPVEMRNSPKVEKGEIPTCKCGSKDLRHDAKAGETHCGECKRTFNDKVKKEDYSRVHTAYREMDKHVPDAKHNKKILSRLKDIESKVGKKRPDYKEGGRGNYDEATYDKMKKAEDEGIDMMPWLKKHPEAIPHVMRAMKVAPADKKLDAKQEGSHFKGEDQGHSTPRGYPPVKKADWRNGDPKSFGPTVEELERMPQSKHPKWARHGGESGDYIHPKKVKKSFSERIDEIEKAHTQTCKCGSRNITHNKSTQKTTCHECGRTFDDNAVKKIGGSMAEKRFYSGVGRPAGSKNYGNNFQPFTPLDEAKAAAFRRFKAKQSAENTKMNVAEKPASEMTKSLLERLADIEKAVGNSGKDNIKTKGEEPRKTHFCPKCRTMFAGGNEAYAPCPKHPFVMGYRKY